MAWNAFEMESSVHAEAGVDAVWAALTDVEAWPRWSEVCVSARVNDGFSWSSGDRLMFRLKMARAAVPFDVGVTRVEEHRLVEWESTEFSITATRAISLQPEDDGVIIRDRKFFRSPVLPVGIVYPRWLIRRMTESWLADLSAEAQRRDA